MAKKTIKVLRVVAKREGFRRCGRRFGGEAVDIPVSELKPGAPAKDGRAATPSELEMLTSDPGLVAVQAEIEVDEPDTAPAKK